MKYSYLLQIIISPQYWWFFSKELYAFNITFNYLTKLIIIFFQFSFCFKTFNIQHSLKKWAKQHGVVVNMMDCDITIKEFEPHLCSYAYFHWESDETPFIISSYCRTISTDIPDPLSQPLLIVHCFWHLLRATSRIHTELPYVGSSWSPCFCSAMWRDPKEYITYELVPTSPAVSCMSSSSNLDSFRDG